MRPANIERSLHGEVHLAAPPELAGEDLLRPPAHSLPEISAIDPEVVAVLVDAVDDDMDMRVVGVVMIHRRPVELTPGVLLDLTHELPSEIRQVDLRWGETMNRNWRCSFASGARNASALNSSSAP
ncbi:MAG TPA: hypothetical protein VN853_20875 [Polyangia bacterium]|nr:hypothetical protein [Polyangia bacterium]